MIEGVSCGETAYNFVLSGIFSGFDSDGKGLKLPLTQSRVYEKESIENEDYI